jgi:UTP--glucose-1-phosphate uridylyltransferase
MIKIKKAVLPVAGFGTRFLPATKAIPKEMLTIIDKPLIEYAVEEAISAGAEEIIFITSHTKPAIKKHFSEAPELEKRLKDSGKD